MRFSLSPAVVAICLVSLTNALPTELERRAAGTQADPIEIQIDCTNDGDVCDVDCHAILCLRAPNPVQYDAKNSAEKRKQSGYKSDLYKHDESWRQANGIYVSDDILNRVGRSAEEAVMANTVQGGWGEILYPVDASSNSHVGSLVYGQLVSNGVTDGKWYLKKFINFPSSAKYCAALEKSVTKRNVCDEEHPDPEDPANRAMVRAAENNNKGGATYHMMDANDRWTGHPYGAQGSYPPNKRNEELPEGER